VETFSFPPAWLMKSRLTACSRARGEEKKKSKVLRTPASVNASRALCWTDHTRSTAAGCNMFRHV